MNFFKDFLLSAAAMHATAIVPLAIYCWRQPHDFNWRQFAYSNRNRAYIGTALMLWISLIINIWPAAKQVIALGLGAGATELAMGFFLGTMLVTFIPGNK